MLTPLSAKCPGTLAPQTQPDTALAGVTGHPLHLSPGGWGSRHSPDPMEGARPFMNCGKGLPGDEGPSREVTEPPSRSTLPACCRNVSRPRDSRLNCSLCARHLSSSSRTLHCERHTGQRGGEGRVYARVWYACAHVCVSAPGVPVCGEGCPHLPQEQCLVTPCFHSGWPLATCPFRVNREPQVPRNPANTQVPAQHGLFRALHAAQTLRGWNLQREVVAQPRLGESAALSPQPTFLPGVPTPAPAAPQRTAHEQYGRFCQQGFSGTMASTCRHLETSQKCPGGGRLPRGHRSGKGLPALQLPPVLSSPCPSSRSGGTLPLRVPLWTLHPVLEQRQGLLVHGGCPPRRGSPSSSPWRSPHSARGPQFTSSPMACRLLLGWTVSAKPSLFGSWMRPQCFAESQRIVGAQWAPAGSVTRGPLPCQH